MPYYDVLWNYEDEDSSIAHIADHGLTPEDVNAVLMAPDGTGVSRSSGRPIAFSYTPDSRYIGVVCEEIALYTLYPVIAFEIRESRLATAASGSSIRVTSWQRKISRDKATSPAVSAGSHACPWPYRWQDEPMEDRAGGVARFSKYRNNKAITFHASPSAG